MKECLIEYRNTYMDIRFSINKHEYFLCLDKKLNNITFDNKNNKFSYTTNNKNNITFFNNKKIFLKRARILWLDLIKHGWRERKTFKKTTNNTVPLKIGSHTLPFSIGNSIQPNSNLHINNMLNIDHKGTMTYNNSSINIFNMQNKIDNLEKQLKKLLKKSK